MKCATDCYAADAIVMEPAPVCDLLLFVTTRNEVDALHSTCLLLKLNLVVKEDPDLGTYYDLGRVGPSRVLAIKTGHDSQTGNPVLWGAFTRTGRIISTFAISDATERVYAHGTDSRTAKHPQHRHAKKDRLQ
jgi:hypothetical protein